MLQGRSRNRVQVRIHTLLRRFANATELISFARENIEDCCIGGGAYPEVHPESVNAEVDIKELEKKVDAGCDF